MTDTNDMRRDFEAWANTLNLNLNRFRDGYSYCNADHSWNSYKAATERATALERERCAALCDERYKGYLNQESMRCAAAIRQGGTHD